MTRSQFIITWRRRPEHNINCFYCGRTFGTIPRAQSEPMHGISRKTVEHVVPQNAYKHGATLANNIVHACSGCNNGKNGYSVAIFREWFGKPFFAEEVLKEAYPVMDNSVKGDGTHRIYFGGMIEEFHQRMSALIHDRFESRDLKVRLHKIVTEARQKSKTPRVKIHV